MSWSTILGAVCVISFLLPVAVILYNRYYTHRSLCALLIYYFILFIDNALGEKIIPSSATINFYVSLLDNYGDVPLMLTALLFFCPDKQKQNKVRLFTGLFIGYEVLITCLFGFSKKSITCIVGPGIVLILAYSSYLFIRQVKFSIYHGKNHGRMIMLASILFGYACYSLIYYFHYIERTPFEADVFMLYYISSIVSSVGIAIGLHLMRRRMQELASLKLTRRELAMFFGPQKTVATVRRD